MHKLFLILLVQLALVGCLARDRVYICVSPGAYAYHRNRDCRGLRACTHVIRAVTSAYAEELGRRRCHNCY